MLLTFASALMLVACGGQKEKKTNEFLREKIAILESENARLRHALYGEQDYPAINFFRQGGKQNILN